MVVWDDSGRNADFNDEKECVLDSTSSHPASRLSRPGPDL